MKRLFFNTVFSLCAIGSFAQTDNTNKPSYSALEIVRAHSHFQQKPSPFCIALPTPEFEEYGFNLMLAEALKFQKAWNLDLRKALSPKDAIFQLEARVGGINGGISTRNGRYRWRFGENSFWCFSDTNFGAQSFRYNDDASAKLAKVKSKINSSEAEALARDFLHRLGLTETQLGLVEPPSVNQYKFEETNGIVYPLPLFNVAWDAKGEEHVGGALEMNISGIIKKPVDFDIFAKAAPQNPLPTNYLDMLGVVKPPMPWGHKLWPKKPGLTNSPASATTNSP